MKLHHDRRRPDYQRNNLLTPLITPPLRELRVPQETGVRICTRMAPASWDVQINTLDTALKEEDDDLQN